MQPLNDFVCGGQVGGRDLLPGDDIATGRSAPADVVLGT